jgi:ABC-type transport system substrate-binding protein
MENQQDSRHRREHRYQTVSFVGALLVLTIVLYAAFVIQSNRREIHFPEGTTVPSPPELTPVPTKQSAEELDEEKGRPPPGGGAFACPECAGVLDPVDCGGDCLMTRALFLGLTMRSLDRETVKPALAELWTVSEDGLTYTFHLRSDVYWVRYDPKDGMFYRMRRVAAADVVYGLSRAFEAQDRAAQALYPILGAQERHQGDSTAPLGVEALDSSTVRIRVVSPTVDLPSLLAHPVAWPVPWEPIAEHAEAWTEPGRIWVNGESAPVLWEPGRMVVVTLNPWWPKELSQSLWPEYLPDWSKCQGVAISIYRVGNREQRVLQRLPSSTLFCSEPDSETD